MSNQDSDSITPDARAAAGMSQGRVREGPAKGKHAKSERVVSIAKFHCLRAAAIFIDLAVVKGVTEKCGLGSEPNETHPIACTNPEMKTQRFTGVTYIFSAKI